MATQYNITTTQGKHTYKQRNICAYTKQLWLQQTNKTHTKRLYNYNWPYINHLQFVYMNACYYSSNCKISRYNS